MYLAVESNSLTNIIFIFQEKADNKTGHLNALHDEIYEKFCKSFVQYEDVDKFLRFVKGFEHL